jgi:hypothetical protein
MLALEERRLIIGILALLMLGAVVRSCRHRVKVDAVPVEDVPSVEEAAVRRD